MYLFFVLINSASTGILKRRSLRRSLVFLHSRHWVNVLTSTWGAFYSVLCRDPDCTGFTGINEQ